jgi:hypothetical protein
MDFRYVMRLEASPDDVFALMLDEKYLRERCAAGGGTDCAISTRQLPDGGALVSVRRRVPARMSAFRGRVGAGHVTVRHTETWSARQADGARTGRFAGEVEGMPGSLAGRLSIAREGDATSYALNGIIDVPVPFVGERLARAVATELTRGLALEEAFTHEWLAAHLQRGG